MSAEGVKIFADAWPIYERVLDRNYMFHDEIRRDLAGILSRRWSPGAYRVLDLGCGDARHVTGALLSCEPSLYVGYDLSATALVHARNHLSRLGCPADLRQADLFDALVHHGPAFELIFSGFAVHHLSSPDKERFLRLARRRLAPEGMLLMVDVCREPGEDRPIYLDRYCGWIRDSWGDLSPSDRVAIEAHIRGHDFPEDNETIHRMATSAGFLRCVDASRYRWHRTWILEGIGTADP